MKKFRSATLSHETWILLYKVGKVRYGPTDYLLQTSLKSSGEPHYFIFVGHVHDHVNGIVNFFFKKKGKESEREKKKAMDVGSTAG